MLKEEGELKRSRSVVVQEIDNEDSSHIRHLVSCELMVKNSFISIIFNTFYSLMYSLSYTSLLYSCALCAWGAPQLLKASTLAVQIGLLRRTQDGCGNAVLKPLGMYCAIYTHVHTRTHCQSLQVVFDLITMLISFYELVHTSQRKWLKSSLSWHRATYNFAQWPTCHIQIWPLPTTSSRFS